MIVSNHLEKRFMRKFVLIGALGVSISLAHAFTSAAQERARIGWAAITASHTPLWVAQVKGFLAKQVCRPELIKDAPIRFQSLYSLVSFASLSLGPGGNLKSVVAWSIGSGTAYFRVKEAVSKSSLHCLTASTI
jgi:hypothetical protein